MPRAAAAKETDETTGTIVDRCHAHYLLPTVELGERATMKTPVLPLVTVAGVAIIENLLQATQKLRSNANNNI